MGGASLPLGRQVFHLVLPRDSPDPGPEPVDLSIVRLVIAEVVAAFIVLAPEMAPFGIDAPVR